MKSVFNKLNLIWLLIIVFVYGLFALFINLGIINAYTEIIIASMVISIILAISLNLIIGITGQFSLGHAGFMAIGAYSTAIILQSMPNYQGLILGILIATVINCVLGLVIAIPTLRLKGDYLAIATLGFSEIIRIVILNINITNGAAGFFGIPRLANWTVLYLGLIITIVCVSNFKNSALGRACISVREDEIAAEAMGINATLAKITAFIVGATFAGLAGAFYASYFFVIKPETFGIAKSIDILVTVVFGGMGSITGSILASIALGIINMLLQMELLQAFVKYKMVLYAVLLIIIMIFRPGGLLGTKEFTVSGFINRFKNKKENKT